MLSIKTKRILYTSAFLVFFTLAPIIIGYSAGFRINWNNFRIFKTGLLYIETNPRLVKIDIGGKTINKMTPYRANNLYPGNYTIEIHKDGYYGWKKEVSIKPGESTLYKNIRLFPISTPEQVLSDIKEIIDFNQYGFIFETESEYAYYLYGDNKPKITIKKTNLSTKPILNQIENSIIYKKDGVYFIEQIGITSSINRVPENKKEIIEATNQKQLNEKEDKEKHPANIKEIYWADNNTIIYIDNDENVFSFGTRDSKLTLLDKRKNQKDIYLKWNDVFYKITNDENSSIVQELKKDFSWKSIFVIPESQSIKYKYDITNQMLNLLDKKRDMWYRLDPKYLSYSIFQNISYVQYTNKNTIYCNDNEIFSIKDRENPVLLTRSSIPIKKSFILPDQSYFFVLYANGDLVINENDTNGKRNTITIASFVEDVFVDQSFSKIYILKEGNLYTMLIK